jgi:hypothetical protein
MFFVLEKEGTSGVVFGKCTERDEFLEKVWTIFEQLRILEEAAEAIESRWCSPGEQTVISGIN